jgi:hypothetical protein
VKNRCLALSAALGVLVLLGLRVSRAEPQLVSRTDALRSFRSDLGLFKKIAEGSDEPDAYELNTYQDSHGYKVDLLISNGVRGPHDSIACYWLRGQKPQWHRLMSIETLISESRAIFDVAIFADRKATPRLVASTECWTDGCREELYRPVTGWIWPSMDIVLGKAKAPVPVAISITSSVSRHDKSDLIAELKSFVATVDLTDIRKVAATR